jgi:mannitol-specific phosphotransferase system IIBC component
MNEKKMNLIGNVIKIGLIAIGVILSFMIIFGPNVNAGKEVVEKFRDGFEMSAAINFMLITLGACIAIIIGFYVLLLITDFKKAIKSMIGILLFAALYFILSMIGSSDTSETLALRNPVADATIDSTHAGLVCVIIGLGVAGVTLIWSFVRKFFL